MQGLVLDEHTFTYAMPDKLRFEPQDNLTGLDFSFRKNTNMATTQANETFVVDARFNRSLGQNGETLGFAKKQYADDPKVQEARDAAYEKAEKEMEKLRKVDGVKKWVADRLELEGLKGAIDFHQNKLNGSIEELKELREADAPDAAKIAQAEREVAEWTQKVAESQLNFETNNQKMKQRLMDQFNQNPSIKLFLQAQQAVTSAQALKDSTGTIAQASSVLYDDKYGMENQKVGGDRQLLARAVASHEVDKMIGLNVCAEEKFGMDPAGGMVGISVQCDGAGIRSAYGTNEYGESQTSFLDIDYSNAAVQKGLNDLQTLDYITGQCDRHAGNMFVDPESGKVTGIDNDLAFPQPDLQTVMDNDTQLAGKFVATMPKIMHEDTAAKIAAIDPGEFRKMLASVRPPNGDKGLGAKEINGAVKRLGELQKAIADAKQGAGGLELVKEFNKETFDKAVKEQMESNHGVTSYIGAVQTEKATAMKAIKGGAVSYQMRGAATVGKAKLNPEYAAFKQQMNPDQKADYLKLQAEVDQLDVKLDAVRKDISKMKNPGIKERVAAIKHGGLEGARQHLFSKEANLVKELRPKMDQLRAMAAPHVETMRQAEELKQQLRGAQNNVAPVQNQPGPAPLGQDNLGQGNDQPKAAQAKIANKGAATKVQAAEDELDMPDLDDDDDLSVDSETEIEAEVEVNVAAQQPAVSKPAAAKQTAVPKNAEDELDMPDLDDDDDLDVDSQAAGEVKQEGLQKSPSVAEMLRRTSSAPALGGHRQDQALGEDGPKPKANTLRASGQWQSAKPSSPEPKVGGGHSASRP